jgi:hypothetical protein
MSFLKSETGAVTADWVVLTAALAGLSLAVSTQLSAGVQKQSADIVAQLRSPHILDAFDRIMDATDFENGRGSWLGGEVRDVPGFGNVLALSGRARSASLPIEIDPEHAFAQVEFDRILADSWDRNETGSISIGGADILQAEHQWWNGEGPTIQTFEGAGDTTVQLTRVSNDSGNWGGSGRRAHDDYTYRVTVVTENDGSDLTLGASTTLNQNGRDEFFGIDNVTVVGTDRP